MATNSLYIDNIPYTYLIGWSEQKKYYYGVQFGKTANPKNLWVKYFTSSNNVKKFREKYGEPDIIKIRKIFKDGEAARLWETKVIQRMNLVSDPKWLNKTDNTSKFYFEGKRQAFSKEHREKISESNRKRKLSDEHKQKLNEGRRNSTNTIKHNNAISAAHKGKKLNEKIKKNMSDARMNMLECDRILLAKNAGIISSEKYKQSPERQNAHSERMKKWWADRKMKLNDMGSI